MARAKNPQREAAMKRWLDSGGALSTKENALMAGATESQVRKWKSADGWAARLGAKGEHGGVGNGNAQGAGAPGHNGNAVTHGAYKTMHLDDLSPECRAYVGQVSADNWTNMERELQLLYAKEYDLKQKIIALENEPPGVLHIERHIVSEDAKGAKTVTEESASAFEHIMRLNDMKLKTHRLILKTLDSMKGYDVERQRLELEERKYRLAKQRASGEYSVNTATGEIEDGADEDGGTRAGLAEG